MIFLHMVSRGSVVISTSGNNYLIILFLNSFFTIFSPDFHSRLAQPAPSDRQLRCAPPGRHLSLRPVHQREPPSPPLCASGEAEEDWGWRGGGSSDQHLITSDH